MEVIYQPPRTIPQAAKELGMSAELVRSHIASGDLEAVNVARRGRRKRWVIHQEAIDRFKERQSSKVTVTPAQRRRKKKEVMRGVIEFF